MRPKVRHIAVMTKNREKMVEFYQKIFGLEPKRGFGGAIYMSDLDRNVRVVSLSSLVRMKLTSFRRKDQVHIQDMIGVGLVDESWCGRYPKELADRLKELLDDPEG